MNKVTIKKLPFKLNKEVIAKGSDLTFKATDKNGEDVNISSYKGMKILSVFPDINTRVCDEQTQKISKWANENKNVNFISLTTDGTEVIAKWCAANGVENVNILSDAKYGEFGELAGMLITKVNKLARGFIILDEENKIVEISVKRELTDDPDYSLVEKYL